MNAAEAKKIHIVDYLKVKGFTPAKEYPGAYWFKSPFRDETEPSFKVHLAKNVFYDFGTGAGGSVIDLVKCLENCNTSEAVRKLCSHSFCFDPLTFPKQSAQLTSKIEMITLKKISSPALIQYIRSREISLKFADKVLKEGNFSLNGRQFFALAFQNDRGGYELRNRNFKGSTSPKHFTTIPGKNNSSINFFEGIFDFLSACQHYGHFPENQTIVLNSLVFLDKAVNTIDKETTVNLYLDNDPAGKKASEIIKTRFTNFTDYSEKLYPDQKDFNQFITLAKY